jgi:hypothetical protein
MYNNYDKKKIKKNPKKNYKKILIKKKKENFFIFSLNENENKKIKKKKLNEKKIIKRDLTIEEKVKIEINRIITCKKNKNNKIHPSWLNSIENRIKQEELKYCGKKIKFNQKKIN